MRRRPTKDELNATTEQKKAHVKRLEEDIVKLVQATLDMDAIQVDYAKKQLKELQSELNMWRYIL